MILAVQIVSAAIAALVGFFSTFRGRRLYGWQFWIEPRPLYLIGDIRGYRSFSLPLPRRRALTLLTPLETR